MTARLRWHLRVVLAGMLAMGCACQSLQQANSDSDAVAKLEDDFGDCQRRQDADCLDRVLAPDWTARWADGSFQTKSDYLASAARHEDVYNSVSTSDLRVRIFGDAAVATGIDTEQSTLSGRDGSGRYAWLDVFAKRRGSWQIVASQSTKLP